MLSYGKFQLLSGCARSEVGPSRLPVTEEIAGSNPVERAKTVAEILICRGRIRIRFHVLLWIYFDILVDLIIFFKASHLLRKHR